jgi:hypothetical protein
MLCATEPVKNSVITKAAFRLSFAQKPNRSFMKYPAPWLAVGVSRFVVCNEISYENFIAQNIAFGKMVSLPGSMHRKYNDATGGRHTLSRRLE